MLECHLREIDNIFKGNFLLLVVIYLLSGFLGYLADRTFNAQGVTFEDLYVHGCAHKSQV